MQKVGLIINILTREYGKKQTIGILEGSYEE